MVNKVILMGRLGKDPDSRASNGGTAIANFNMATNRNYKTKDGEKKEETEWHRIVCFGKQAEIASAYLHKGSQVYVEGRIQTREWEDKEGNKRWTTEVVCERFQMLGSKGDNVTKDADANAPETHDDEVPF